MASDSYSTGGEMDSSPNNGHSHSPLPRSHQSTEPLLLTVNNVYALGKEIAREIHEDGTHRTSKEVIEKVVKALEWLETYVEEVEELRTTNYRLLLKADEVVREKERRAALEHELKGMQLVAEERGRQRDTLAHRVAELESQNNYYQAKIDEIEQTKSLMIRRERYSSAKLDLVSGSVISEEDIVSVGANEGERTDYMSRTRSLDRRSLKGRSSSKQKDSNNLSQLQRELATEKRKVTEMRESRALEQRRVQSRLKHMEQEITSLTRQLQTSQILVDKLTKEKMALLERSEVLTEVKAITLATIARGSLQQHENGEHSFEKELSMESSPKFYKKDLLMILQDRNELKEKVSILQDKLKRAKKKLSQYENVTPISSRGHSPAPRSNTCTPNYEKPPQNITERIEDSMIIVDFLRSSSNHHLQIPSSNRPSSLTPSPDPYEGRGGEGSPHNNNSSSNGSSNPSIDKCLETSLTRKKSFELSTSL